MRINFVPNQCFQNFEGENAMISGRKLKHSTKEGIPATNSGRNFWEKQHCKPMERSFHCIIANSVGSTDNRDQVMNALGTVPGHNDVINAHELRQIVRGLKSKKAAGNDGIPSKRDAPFQYVQYL